MSQPTRSWTGRITSLLGNNVFGLLALVIATSGTAYAAATIDSADVVDNSLKSVDVKDSTLTHRDMVAGPWQAIKAASAEGNCDPAVGQPKVGEFCLYIDDGYWSNYGGGYPASWFRKDATGEVTLQGLVRPPLFGHRIFILPAGYRPPGALLFPVACGRDEPPYDGAGVVRVDRDGAVTYRTGDCDLPFHLTWVSLTGIQFPVDVRLR